MMSENQYRVEFKDQNDVSEFEKILAESLNVEKYSKE